MQPKTAMDLFVWYEQCNVPIKLIQGCVCRMNHRGFDRVIGKRANKSWSYLSSTHKMNDFNGGPVVPPHVVSSPSCSCTSSWMHLLQIQLVVCYGRPRWDSLGAFRDTDHLQSFLLENNLFPVRRTAKGLKESTCAGHELPGICVGSFLLNISWSPSTHCDMTVNPQNNVGVCDLYSRESCESVIGCIRQASLCNSLL